MWGVERRSLSVYCKAIRVALGSNLTGGPLVAPVRDDAGHSGRSRAVSTSYVMRTEGPRPLGARSGHGQPW